MASEITESLPIEDGDANCSTITADLIHFKKMKGSNTIVDFTTTNGSPSSSTNGKVIAAMPAYNEEKFIGKTVVGCKPYVNEVIVINDGSTDATAMIATACGATVIYHEQNMGYGASIRTCFETAKKMQATAMVILDADGPT
ncbi:glycosyltransferase [uncultured Methanomethylovorans sp.]|uniref:glycosyltransferase n=1 Tax=uncultured Methanomethylovorans sp. TaxID=183759 RepID=UPI002AA90DA3|nr:glycosyltransferase [uncultured Methanomethylovorans sp.]